MKKMTFDVIPGNLGKILIVDNNPIRAALRKRWLLQGEGNSVDVVHRFFALITLDSPNHGYDYVLLGNRVIPADKALSLLKDVIPSHLGKVLIVDTNSEEAEIKRMGLLQREGNSVVDVDEHLFVALMTLGSPKHGYDYVLLGNQVLPPDKARGLIQKELDFFAD